MATIAAAESPCWNFFVVVLIRYLMPRYRREKVVILYLSTSFQKNSFVESVDAQLRQEIVVVWETKPVPLETQMVVFEVKQVQLETQMVVFEIKQVPLETHMVVFEMKMLR